MNSERRLIRFKSGWDAFFIGYLYGIIAIIIRSLAVTAHSPFPPRVTQSFFASFLSLFVSRALKCSHLTPHQLDHLQMRKIAFLL